MSFTAAPLVVINSWIDAKGHENCIDNWQPLSCKFFDVTIVTWPTYISETEPINKSLLYINYLLSSYTLILLLNWDHSPHYWGSLRSITPNIQWVNETYNTSLSLKSLWKSTWQHKKTTFVICSYFQWSNKWQKTKNRRVRDLKSSCSWL